jgi:hypothetical protein
MKIISVFPQRRPQAAELTLAKRLLVLFVCFVGVGSLLNYVFGRGLLSPRGLGVALLILCIALVSGFLLSVKKSAKEFAMPLEPDGTATNATTRKLLLWRMRRAKKRIVIMVFVLALALINFRSFPLLPLLVGVALNLLITARSVQIVFRIKKALNCERGDVTINVSK